MMGPMRFGFGPKPPPAADAAPKEYRPGFMETLDAVLGGQTITDARKSLTAEHQDAEAAALQRQQVAALMETVLTDPRERLAFLANKPEWAKSVSTNFAAGNVDGGATRQRPGFDNFTATKIGIDGDSAYTQTPDSFEVTGRREPSFKEQSDIDIKERLADIREMLAGSTMSRNSALNSQGAARVGQGADRVAIARQKASGARPAAGNSPALEAIAAELKRRGKL